MEGGGGRGKQYDTCILHSMGNTKKLNCSSQDMEMDFLVEFSLIGTCYLPELEMHKDKQGSSSL